METEKRLNEALNEMEKDISNDKTLQEYSEALNDFKRMVEEGIAKPRGNHQEDITARHQYIYQ